MEEESNGRFNTKSEELEMMLFDLVFMVLRATSSDLILLWVGFSYEVGARSTNSFQISEATRGNTIFNGWLRIPNRRAGGLCF